jgi:hypothetical protein
MTEPRNPAFPVFSRHHGVWEGTYTLMDAKTGQILDTHKSKLTCEIGGPHGYYQRNEYTWADGRVEVKEFPGTFDGGWLKFETPRLVGQSCEVDANTIYLTWVYTHEPDNSYSELITLVDDNHRSRIWQHFENGEYAKITVIDERRVSEEAR